MSMLGVEWGLLVHHKASQRRIFLGPISRTFTGGRSCDRNRRCFCENWLVSSVFPQVPRCDGDPPTKMHAYHAANCPFQSMPRAKQCSNILRPSISMRHAVRVRLHRLRARPGSGMLGRLCAFVRSREPPFRGCPAATTVGFNLFFVIGSVASFSQVAVSYVPQL